MRSLWTKLTLAFLGVALVAVGLLGLLVGRATRGAFGDYLLGRRTGDLGEMERMMEEMMGPVASQSMVEQMLGPAEQAYLATVNSALWLAGVVAALVAVGLGLLLARQISRPVRDLTSAARQVGEGDYEGRVPVRGRDELGQLAATFNTMAAAIGRQENLRRRMAADIAHELRTPLAVVQANLEAILDGVRPLTHEAVSDIHRETQLLSRLITDLRDLSLAEAGQLPLHKRSADLGELARTSVARFSSSAEEKGVRLTVEAPEGISETEVDPDRLSQVLGNLLENAIRHTPPGREVAVRLEPFTRTEEVRVTVRDGGPGVPQEHLPNVFDRFYRADGARARANGGSGIGLAVVKQLVEAHGGRVWAENRPDEGATFGFALPAPGAREGPDPSADTPVSKGWSRNGGGQRA